MPESEAEPPANAGALAVTTGGAGPVEDADAFYARKRWEEEDTYLSVRIPRRQDIALARLLFQAKERGIRVNKSQLVRLALDELPATFTPELALRLGERGR